VQVRPDEEQHEGAGELIRFMILVAILLLIVLVVAASRPFVFERLVPAALGWGTPAAGDLTTVPSTATPTALPTPLATPLGADGADTLTTPETVGPAPTVTALPTATPQSYQVQPGDNLTTIARRFGLSVEALVVANGLTNPDRLTPGDLLIIPTP
jgi:LysM repeat protein